MQNFTFVILLGVISLIGTRFGLSWELVLSLLGAALGIVSLIRAEASERTLRDISDELRVLPEVRKELRGRLQRLVRRPRRSQSRASP